VDSQPGYKQRSDVSCAIRPIERYLFTGLSRGTEADLDCRKSTYVLVGGWLWVLDVDESIVSLDKPTPPLQCRQRGEHLLDIDLSGEQLVVGVATEIERDFVQDIVPPGWASERALVAIGCSRRVDIGERRPPRNEPFFVGNVISLVSL
jgi:hypothetical protein